jgi:hypothetical protein
MRWGPEDERMPPTQEVKCTDEDCFVDMFEAHYTYDVPDEHGVEDLSCPACGGRALEAIEL